MGGIMQNALIMKNYHPAVIRHHYLSGSFRFLTSTPLKKYSQHVNCHSKYQAILRWNRSLSPLHANSSHNAFYSSSSWSKGIFTSYFGQNFVSVKNFDHLSRHGRAKAGQRVNVLVKWTKSLLFNLIKVFGTLCLIISLVIIAAPSFLSSSVGLHSAVWLTNKVIPGKASIKSISIGWTTPVSIEEVLLEGTDGKTVLVIPKIETKASLWSFIAGRAGFGHGLLHEEEEIRRDNHLDLQHEFQALTILSPKNLWMEDRVLTYS